MEKNNQIFAPIAAIMLLALSGMILLMNYSQKKEIPACVNSEMLGLEYSACYSQNINSTVLKITSRSAPANLSEIKVKLVDGEASIKDILNNTSKQYIFQSSFSEKLRILPIIEGREVCNEKQLQVELCKSELAVSLVLSDAQKIKVNLTQAAGYPFSNILGEESYNSQCESYWECSEWEECLNSLQKRECTDKNRCVIPTKIPDSEKRCGEECREKWECQWSACISGYTYAECADSNKCQTEYSKPEKLKCREKGEEQCIPSVSCSEWEECRQDYNFISLSSGIQAISGIKSRICRDRNNCIYPSIETRPCSVQTDVYLKKSEKCSGGILEIYSKLDNSLLSALNYSGNKLSIQLFTSNLSSASSKCF